MQQQPVQFKEFVSTISSKGQVTVPIFIRRYLRVQAKDKVAFMVEPAKGVRLSQAKYPDVRSLKGAAGALGRPMEWKEVIKIAYEDRPKKKYGR